MFKNKKCLLLIAVLFTQCLLMQQHSFAQSKYNKLIWSDEFNYNGAPDSAKWGYDIGGSGWGNNELEYYTDRLQNAVVKNGVLKITALKENYKGRDYTSARIVTKGKFSFKYGRVEVRAKLPSGVGTWPALWMLGSNVDSAHWPACGEIDIMEHLGRDMHTIYGTLHYPGHYGDHANGKTTPIKDATQFHIYGLEWTPSVIKISVDGKVYQTVPNSADIPFNHNFFIILNMAMGGNFGGPVDPNVTKATMEIDYVRVYQ